MTTLQQQRQAIAAGMSTSRAATGQAERDAAGQAMIERRTGKAVADDINRLTSSAPQRKTLRPVEPVGALPASRGRGEYKAPPAAAAGGGIASPLVEQSFDERKYWPERAATSVDGLFTLYYRPIRETRQLDANGAEVVNQWAEPT